MSFRTYKKPPTAEISAKLSPLQIEITQACGTEPPFQNAYWDNHEEGLYVDIVSGEPLFSSRDKFDSGTGWPSFTRPVEPRRVTMHTDRSHGMARVEVKSTGANSHLGHLFDDGPGPGGQRYCINSASLRFIARDRLQGEGYGEYLPLFEKAARGQETAVLAGGCFWGMQEILRAIPGVIETGVGYAGGTTASPTYPDVKTGATGHAEAVRVVFDPAKLSFADLLERWFFRMHDPTTANRQGHDTGTQYRSAIFFASEEQGRVAEEVKARVNASGKWKRPIVTQIVAAGPFFPAEDYHQDYLQKNPGGYSCHFMRD